MMRVILWWDLTNFYQNHWSSCAKFIECHLKSKKNSCQKSCSKVATNYSCDISFYDTFNMLHSVYNTLYIINISHEGLNQPPLQINGAVQLAVFLHVAACPAVTLGWMPQGARLFPAECTRLGLPMFAAGMPLRPSKATHGLYGWEKEERGGRGRVKDPLNLLRCTALLPSTLCYCWAEGLGSFVRRCSFWKIFLVGLISVVLCNLHGFLSSSCLCAGHAYRDIFGVQWSVLSPYFLDTLCEPRAQTFPSGESEVTFLMLHPPQQRKPTLCPSLHGRADFHCCLCWRGMNPLVPVHAASGGYMHLMLLLKIQTSSPTRKTPNHTNPTMDSHPLLSYPV